MVKTLLLAPPYITENLTGAVIPIGVGLWPEKTPDLVEKCGTERLKCPESLIGSDTIANPFYQSLGPGF